MSSAPQIAGLLEETGLNEPREAVRHRARSLLTQFASVFGPLELPVNMELLASFLDIRLSEEPPTHSDDAELVPVGDGSVQMRVNANRPETRRRFSMAHEIAHTFFPGYNRQVQCRPDPRHRSQVDPLESLCDIGASELVFPSQFFQADAAGVASAEGLHLLAERYGASVEATIRRLAETTERNLAAIVFSWKLKPSQKRTIGRPDQITLFGIDPVEDAGSLAKLRIDYSIPSPSFSASGHFLPAEKSVEVTGAFALAGAGHCGSEERHLDLGGFKGLCRVFTVPLYVPSTDRGPNGELGVAAVVEVIDVKKPRKKAAQVGPTLFD